MQTPNTTHMKTHMLTEKTDSFQFIVKLFWRYIKFTIISGFSHTTVLLKVLGAI